MKIMVAVLFALVELSAAGKKIQRKDLPIAVQHTVQSEEAAGATIVGLATEVEGGRTMYEIETTVHGHTRDLLVAKDGQIVETEEETSIDVVPAAVKNALEARGKIGKVETVIHGKTVTYEAVVERNGKKTEVAVNSLGKPVKP